MSQEGLHQADTSVLILIQKSAEVTSRPVSSIAFEKAEQIYSWQIQEVLSKPVLKDFAKVLMLSTSADLLKVNYFAEVCS